MRGLNELPRAGKGAYVLQCRLDEECTIAVGRLAVVTFRPGRYLYVGSALGGLRGRLLRHLRGGRKHWHLDYLLPHAKVETAYVRVSPERWECRLAQALADAADAPAPGFGSSGCSCVAHLFHVAGEQALTQLEDLGLERLHLDALPERE